MANHLYGGYGSSYSDYSSRFSSDRYSRYASADPLAASSEFSRYSSSSLDFGSSLYSEPSRVGGYSSLSGLDRTGSLSGVKRSAEALYHQNVLGSHNTIGQSEGLFSSNSVFKYPRLETASSLPIYPQRPGEKDCAHYMQTRTCKFGDACKFHHPEWVPENGIPSWTEPPQVQVTPALPERSGEPDCPFYLKTKTCKFGFHCKFNHPKEKSDATTVGDAVVTGSTDTSVLPERPSEPICSYYSKTGKCKFGANCKFHHPKDLQVPSSEQNTGKELIGAAAKDNGVAGGDSVPKKTFTPFTPALLHNSKGLPIRPGETDCPFYMKTGSCKYGATCRYNHPDIASLNPALAGNLGHSFLPSSAASLPLGLVNPAANFMPTLDPLLARASLGANAAIYPQRPGELECDFYMKTGVCKFGERCKFHHPIDRSAPAAPIVHSQPNVKLTLAGLPRREGSASCPFYMKTGTCKFGVSCKFDHPPPSEAVAMAAVQGNATEAAGDDEKATAAPSG